MGMNEIRNAAKINSIFSIVHEYKSNGLIEEAIQTLREAIKVYPNNYGFLSELAIALTLKINTDTEYELVNEAIALSERVLINSTSEKLRSTTRANLCFLYLKANENEKAMNLAKSLPHVWECREMLLPDMLSGNEYDAELRKGIITIIFIISQKIKNSKNFNLSGNDKTIAIGPCTNSDDDLKVKIELLMQFLDIASP